MEPVLSLEGHERQERPARVLVVSDDPAFAPFYELILRGSGVEVDWGAPAGETKGVEVPGGDIDLAIVDRNRPGTEPVEFLRDVRGRVAGTTPVIFVDICRDEVNERRLLAESCDEYLAKPVDLHRVRDLVCSYVAPEKPRTSIKKSPML
ncbi:MAG: response regulator [Promethearchaeota archaeon]